MPSPSRPVRAPAAIENTNRGTHTGNGHSLIVGQGAMSCSITNNGNLTHASVVSSPRLNSIYDTSPSIAVVFRGAMLLTL